MQHHRFQKRPSIAVAVVAQGLSAAAAPFGCKQAYQAAIANCMQSSLVLVCTAGRHYLCSHWIPDLHSANSMLQKQLMVMQKPKCYLVGIVVQCDHFSCSCCSPTPLAGSRADQYVKAPNDMQGCLMLLWHSWPAHLCTQWLPYLHSANAVHDELQL